MIRPNEITNFVIDDIDKWLSKDSYKEIEIAEDIGDILIKAKKSFYGYLFDVNIKYDDTTRIVRTIVHSSTPVPEEKRMFCLQLLNHISLYDEELKYILCPFNSRISSSTASSIFDDCFSIGELTYFWAGESILNITNVHLTIKYDDVRICELNPIRFHNFL